MICGPRLRQIREARRLSQKQLAESLGVPQPVISQLESEAKLSDASLMRRVADELRIPVELLMKPPVSLPEGSLGLFRSSRSKVPAESFHSARRLAEIGVEVLIELSNDHRLPACRIEAIPGATPEEAAIYARSMLGLPPDEPIRNLTSSIEQSGGWVIKLSNMHDEISGFSAWMPRPIGRPFIALRRETSAFRLRFTLAHELGHLVLGHQVFGRPQKDTEMEAYAFASHLLLPEDAMRDVFTAEMDLREIARIKGRYGVSMGAILMRAKGMGYISHDRYRSLYETMRRKGWIRSEPGDQTSVPEEPVLLTDLMRRRSIPLDELDLALRVGIGVSDARILLPSRPDYDLRSL